MADRLAVSTNSYHSYSLEEALAGIAAAGFTSVELSSVPGWTEHVSRDASDSELDQVRKQVDGAGLTALSMSGHSDLASDEGAVAFRKALHIASQLDIPYVTTSTGGHDDSSQGSIEDQRREFLERFAPLADEAADAGISICIETHGGLSSTGAKAAELVEAISKPNVGINYDTANVIFYGDVRPEEDIRAAAKYVNHLHVKDKAGGDKEWNFPAIGTGNVDFAPIFKTLADVGFTGPVSVELEFQGEPWPPLEQVNEAMKTSLAFIRQHLPESQLQ
ncbi:MAG TPA: sugar phosphate isomerase/epimerase family protein [Thermomicrobiales bacterium]|nr:sugar phosphate isomerase/epimerase family protein [Thermomicrobiales bacterium]